MAESDFDDVVRSIRSRFPHFAGGGIRTIIILVVLAVIGFTMFYTIDPEEIGVVLRLGKYVRSTEPGLHLKLPLGIERVTKVPVQRQLKEEFGFQTVSAGVRSQFSDRG
ncbi:MAG: SPFH domain-containing protein, partial [bacterium]